MSLTAAATYEHRSERALRPLDDGGSGRVSEPSSHAEEVSEAAPLLVGPGFTQRYQDLQPRALQLALKLCRNAHDAEDIVQEAFLRAFQGLHRLEDPGRFDAWLMRITRNAALDRMRRASRCRPSLRATDERTDELAGAERVVRRSGAAEAAPPAQVALRMELAALGETSRSALELHYLRGMSCQEIADREGVSVGCIRTRLHRARRQVRSAVEALR